MRSFVDVCLELLGRLLGKRGKIIQTQAKLGRTAGVKGPALFTGMPGVLASATRGILSGTTVPIQTDSCPWLQVFWEVLLVSFHGGTVNNSKELTFGSVIRMLMDVVFMHVYTQWPSGALFSFFGKGSPLKSTNQKRDADSFFSHGNPLGI